MNQTSRFVLPAITLLLVLVIRLHEAVGQEPKKEAWQNDYKKFEDTFAKAIRDSNPQAPFNEFNDLFAKKEVRWTLKFKVTEKNKDGLLLKFDGVPPTIKILSSKADEIKWQAQKPESSVVVAAKSKIAFTFTLNPGTAQEQKIGSIIFEEAKLVDEARK